MTAESKKIPADADLATLWAALRSLPPPAQIESRLRDAFRARAGLAERLCRPRSRRQRWDALAAGVGTLAVAALVALAVGNGLDLDGPFGRPAHAVRDAAAATDSLAGFEPLPYGPGISPSATYSVLRVRIPLSSLTMHTAGVDGTIDADLLVGEDGLASGIRFDPASTLTVSASQ